MQACTGGLSGSATRAYHLDLMGVMCDACVADAVIDTVAGQQHLNTLAFFSLKESVTAGPLVLIAGRRSCTATNGCLSSWLHLMPLPSMPT